MNRSSAGSRSSCGVCCAIVLALSESHEANAQEPANRSLPPCDSAAPTSFPCRTPFDQPPVSAGVAVFADSEHLARPELGTLYRYLSLDSLPLDVFVYPDSAWPSPGGQVRDFITALDVMRDRGDFVSYEVQKQGELKIKVRGGRPPSSFVRYCRHEPQRQLIARANRPFHVDPLAA